MSGPCCAGAAPSRPLGTDRGGRNDQVERTVRTPSSASVVSTRCSSRRPPVDRAARGHRPRRPAGRVRLGHRPVRMRQVDPDADRRRPDVTVERRPSTVNGKTAEQARRDRDYGIVFQAPVLFDWRTVEDNVKLPLEVLGWDRRPPDGPGEGDARPRRARRLREHHPFQLSGGMRSASRSAARSCPTRRSS